MATVLAIETSCDETSVALVEERRVLAQTTASQVRDHAIYGGVVPEVASRRHLETLNPTLAVVLEAAGRPWSAIDAVAATCAPGLVGALWMGLTCAKTLALVHRKPLIGVHHLEGHVCAAYLTEQDLAPPFLCLLVSGGHTSLIGVEALGQYQILGQTRDDAAGEAYDKVARLLGLGYPGGPVLDRLAQQGNPQAFPLPEGQISLSGGGYHPYDMSFSGLKTAVLRLVQRLTSQGDLPIADLAASFQATVIQALSRRALACAQDHGYSTIVVGGGVAANRGLRHHLQSEGARRGLRVIFPPLAYCTDNAAMIGCAAAGRLALGQTSALTLEAQSRLPLTAADQLYV
ncbi:MAG: tRNA (adenosine(37)-N6)-threonylcarbamoyltransferase complex transferase subunit TsaD [Gloeomargaritaceae cyanobacterium C42_A2020_066]|nr:tRNA (adenosine(37)-N6)-threonylcarbamoyltransferase complex transferase subunit TsaD [Gloeomargaritaceae cyanobacterium C42_A2020_066]